MILFCKRNSVSNYVIYICIFYWDFYHINKEYFFRVNMSKRSARDHTSCLAAICCCCGRKRSLRPVKAALEIEIHRFITAYSLKSNLHLTVICDTCRKTIQATTKDPEQTSRRMPPLMDYKLLFPQTSQSSGEEPFNPKTGRWIN